MEYFLDGALKIEEAENFSAKDLAHALVKELDNIRVVPNPYYAYAGACCYEEDKLDTRVKITNLPEQCSINIYTVNGTLVRQFKKDNPTITSQ